MNYRKLGLWLIVTCVVTLFGGTTAFAETKQEILDKCRKHVKAGRAQEAIAECNKVLAIDLENIDAYFWRGNAYLIIADYEAAISDFSRVLLKQPNDTEALNNRGAAYREKRAFDKALMDSNKALSLDPNYVEAYNTRGRTYGYMLKFDEAMADFTKALEFKNKSTKVNFDAYLGRGWILLEQQKYEEAISDLTNAILLDPSDTRGYQFRSLAYYYSGNKDGALADSSKMILLAPRYTQGYIQRGYFYYEKGQYAESIADSTKAIEVDPKNVAAYNNRARANQALGRTEETLTDCDAAISIDPMYGRIYITKAMALERLGRMSEAIESYKLYLQRSPSNDEWRGYAQEKLKRVGEVSDPQWISVLQLDNGSFWVDKSSIKIVPDSGGKQTDAWVKMVSNAPNPGTMVVHYIIRNSDLSFIQAESLFYDGDGKYVGRNDFSNKGWQKPIPQSNLEYVLLSVRGMTKR